MNRDQAKDLVLIGKGNINLIAHAAGDNDVQKFLDAWVDNWEFIKAFAEGELVTIGGIEYRDIGFNGDQINYKIVKRKLNWKKVIENGGLNAPIEMPGGDYFLVGVTPSGLPICQEVTKGGECKPFAVINHTFSLEASPKEEWFDYE